MRPGLAATLLIASSVFVSACAGSPGAAPSATTSGPASWPSPGVDPLAVAMTRSSSRLPPRAVELRQGTFGSLYGGPADIFRDVPEAQRDARLARRVWLVVLVGMYDGSCPLEPRTCPPVEGREELLIDAANGAILASSVVAPAPGGITNEPRDVPCGPDECGP